MIRSTLCALPLSAALLVTGCGSTNGSGTTPGDDGGGSEQDSAATGVTGPDADAPPDAGSAGDAASPKDAGEKPADAGGHSDAGTNGGGPIPPDAGVNPPSGPATSLLVQVTNSCPVDLWIHGAGQEGTLLPDNAHLTPGKTQQYYGYLTWTAARINAYLEAPDGTGTPQGQSDKVEMNFGTTSGSEWLNTDITYVDWVALPSKVEAIGTGSDCTVVGCQLPYDHILNGCPASLVTGHECLSARSYCLDPTKDGDPFCHVLDGQITACASQYSDCAGATGSTTADVYACAGAFFGQSPEYCAALNRGVLSQPAASTPPSAFYSSPPYNAYAAWVHATCPGIYAFPYDDFGSTNQSSDHTCTGAKQLNITFCPKG
jgi:hypothetical protein